MAKKRSATKDGANQALSMIDDMKFLQEVVRRDLQLMLEAEMAGHIGAERYERTEGRSGPRNGYKPRLINLRVGTIELAVPQARDGSFFNRAVRPLPEKRKGLGLGHDGDVPERGVHKESGLRSPKRYAARPF